MLKGKWEEVSIVTPREFCMFSATEGGSNAVGFAYEDKRFSQMAGGYRVLVSKQVTLSVPTTKLRNRISYSHFKK